MEVTRDVEFIYKGAADSVVLLNGSFDGWASKQPMIWDGKVYKLTVPIKGGRYQFKFQVNDDWRLSDDYEQEPDSNGTINNVRDVKPKFETSAPTQVPAVVPAPVDTQKRPDYTKQHSDIVVILNETIELTKTLKKEQESLKEDSTKIRQQLDTWKKEWKTPVVAVK